MTNLQKLKEDVRKEFDNKFKMDSNGGVCAELQDEDGGTDYELVKYFIDSLITKAYEEGKREILERVKLETDTNVCECGKKWIETDLADYVNNELRKPLKLNENEIIDCITTEINSKLVRLKTSLWRIEETDVSVFVNEQALQKEINRHNEEIEKYKIAIEYIEKLKTKTQTINNKLKTKQ